ncbi:MAG: LacI family DNA-binding transcriptional regulator [Spirochaetaceae bacterium]|nr:LacI family DNA-binding transcriptional regulator [Spirochaetaceae bacterium]
MDESRLTVKEIARLAGVSIGTVDRVLHGRRGVSPETKKKIDGIVTSLGYEPNILARALSLNRSYLLRVVLPRASQDSGYWTLCLGGIERAARDSAPYGVRVHIEEVDRYDRRAYRELLERIVADPGDGLVFAPFLPDELAPVLRALQGKVPYVFFDGSIEDAEPLSIVSQDAYRGGYLAGRVMSLLVPGSGNLLALGVHEEVRHIRERIEGFRAYFEDAGGLDAPVPWIREAFCAELEKVGDCDEVLERVFARDGGIAGVMVANSAGHLVGDWLAARGARSAQAGAAQAGSAQSGVALLSWDLVPDNARALREGRIDCVLSQRPADQGREAVERLARFVVRGELPEGPPVIPLEVYFKENLPLDEGGEGEGGSESPSPSEAS